MNCEFMNFEGMAQLEASLRNQGWNAVALVKWLMLLL